jgi:HPt (histidine-containing phosphotransfer) domain-containing protein
VAEDNPGDALQVRNSIDTHCGLANVGGNGVLYRRVLGLFLDHEADFAKRFNDARGAGDADAAMRAAHDLKGLAGTLGMHAVQAAAVALERGCLHGARGAEVDAMVCQVSRHLDEVIDELRAMELETVQVS